MTWIEKALSKPVSKEEWRYSLTVGEMEFLYRMAKTRPYEMASAAFRCGFEKGRRCERARQKRQQKSSQPPKPTKAKG